MNDYRIGILYVDDAHDMNLSSYLTKFCEERDYTYRTHEFIPSENSHIKFLASDDFRTADIVILDSQLYRSDSEYTLKGEGLLVYLQDKQPFKKYYLISSQTEQDIRDAAGILSKYNKSEHYEQFGEFDNYYSQLLDSQLEDASLSIKNTVYRLNNQSIPDLTTAESLIDKFKGHLEYSTLTDSNLNELISLFEEVKEEMERMDDFYDE